MIGLAIIFLIQIIVIDQTILRMEIMLDNNITLPNIESVSYSSNGNFLNITFWLSNRNGDSPTFEQEPTEGNPHYVVYLDVDANPETGYTGADYAFGVRWIDRVKAWYKEFVEFSSTGKQKSLMFENASTDLDFFDPQNDQYIYLMT